MSPIRLGFVGLSASAYGWAASTLVPPLLEPPLSSKYTITAVSTTKPDSANSSADKYSKLTSRPVKPYYGSTEQIANDTDVDMVAIAVRTSGHVEASIPVLRAKKDLFIEWPAGKQLAGTKEIYDLTKKHGVRTLVGFQTRQAAYVRRVKEILDSGVLGRVLSTSLIASFCFPVGRGSSGWNSYSYLYDAANGTTMLDIDGGHLVDVLHFLFGPISTVTAHLANQYPTIQLVDASGKPAGEPIPQTDVHQVVFGGQFANKDGTVLSVHIRNVQNDNGGVLFWVIDGEKGSIKITAEGIKAQTFMRAQPELWLNGEKVDIVTDTESERAARYWDLFAERKEGDYATMEDALRAKQVIDGVWRSNKEGKRIHL